MIQQDNGLQKNLSQREGQQIALTKNDYAKHNSDVRYRSLSNNNSGNLENNLQKSGTGSFIDETFLTHRRRKLIENKNSDAVISNRSLSRAKQRVSSKYSSSRSASDNQQALLNAPNSPGLSINSDKHLQQQQNSNQNIQNVIEEQDLEETIGDEIPLQFSKQKNQNNQEQKIVENQKQIIDEENDKEKQSIQQKDSKNDSQKNVITYDMLQSLQQTKQAEKIIQKAQQSHQNHDQKQNNNTDNKPLTQSWEKSIKETSTSFVSDLFSKFGSFGQGSQQKSKPSQIVQQTGYNRKVTLYVSPDKKQPNIKEIEIAKIDTAKLAVHQNIGFEQLSQSKNEETFSTLRVQDSAKIENQSSTILISQDDLQEQLSQHSVKSKRPSQEIQINKLNQDQVSNDINLLAPQSHLYLIQETLSLVNIDKQRLSPSHTVYLTAQNSLNVQVKMSPRKSDDILEDIDKFQQSQSNLSALKEQDQVLLEMSFNQQQTHIQTKNLSLYKDVSFQGSKAKLFENKNSEIMETASPTSQSGFESEQYNQAKNLTKDTLDLLFYYIIKDELKSAVQKVEKETEEQVVKVSLYRAEDELIDTLLEQSVDILKQDMYQKFLDKIISQAQDKVVEKIIDEYILLFELATPENTASYIAEQLELKMVNKLIDFLDKEDTLQSERLKEANDAINLKQIIHFNNQEQNYLDHQEYQERNLSKIKNIKHSKSPLKSKTNYLLPQKDGIIDLEFFQKCFFGKSLHVKDQIIFKIYAKELLDLIKDNLTKSMKKKFKQFIKGAQGKRSKSRCKSKQKQIQNRSPSPFDHYNKQNKRNLPQVRRSQTPTNLQSRDQQNFQLVQDYYNTLNNIKNMTITQELQSTINQPISINIIDNNAENLNFYSEQQNKQVSNQQKSSDTSSQKVISLDVPQRDLTNSTPYDQSENDVLSSSVRSRKKRQPSQIKGKTIEISKTAQPKSPAKQQQFKILQNLESQMKEILKNDRQQRQNAFIAQNTTSGNIRQIKLKKRNAHTNVNSVQNSPNRAATTIMKNQFASTINAPKELPAVKKVNRYKLATAVQSNSMILDQDQSQTISYQTQQYLQEATLNYKNQLLSQDNSEKPVDKNQLDIGKHGFIDNYLLSSRGSQIISQGNSIVQMRDLNSRETYRPETSDIIEGNQNGYDFSQLRSSSIVQNMAFAPQQKRSISVIHKTVNASNLIRRLKSNKRGKQQSLDNSGYDLNSTTISNRIKRPQSKSQFMHQGIKDLSNTFNQILQNQTSINYSSKKNGQNDLPLNSDRYKKIIKSQFNNLQNDYQSTDYNNNIIGNHQPQLSNVGIKKINQNQLQKYGQTIMRPPTLKASNYKNINKNQSFIDRQNLSGQVQLQKFDQFTTQDQQSAHQQQQNDGTRFYDVVSQKVSMERDKRQDLSSQNYNTQLSKYSVPELNIQQRMPNGQNQKQTLLYSSDPQQQTKVDDLAINSDRIKNKLSQKQNHTDINLEQYKQL